MSKIVTAINVMVSNPYLISNATVGYNQKECFFKYDGKHVWSIFNIGVDQFVMSYYTDSQTVETLSSIPDEHFEEAAGKYVAYSSKELGTKEALQSMSELYTIVKEKALGMDDALDDIINSSPDF